MIQGLLKAVIITLNLIDFNFMLNQVPPAELEAILLSHPEIKDAAVIGIPDEAAGELPRAFIVKQPGALITKEEVIKFVSGTKTINLN